MAGDRRNVRQRRRTRKSPAAPSSQNTARPPSSPATQHQDGLISHGPRSASLDLGFWLLSAIVFVVAVAIHWFIVDNAEDWVYDDGSVIEDNPMVKGNAQDGPQQPLSQLLYTDYWGTPMNEDRLSHLSFRPFTSLTFRLQVHHLLLRCCALNVLRNLTLSLLFS